MNQSFLGVTCVLILFAICLILGYLVIFIKYRHFQKPEPSKKTPEVFYLTPIEKPKRKRKKDSATPLKATLVNKEDLKRLLGK